MNGDEMGVSDFLDEFGLAQPLLVRGAFELDHSGEGIHPI